MERLNVLGDLKANLKRYGISMTGVSRVTVIHPLDSRENFDLQSGVVTRQPRAAGRNEQKFEGFQVFLDGPTQQLNGNHAFNELCRWLMQNREIAVRTHEEHVISPRWPQAQDAERLRQEGHGVRADMLETDYGTPQTTLLVYSKNPLSDSLMEKARALVQHP
ncbi:hypothetical protein HY572_03655 [Candidatus Micrarchaeota archaeon]|nr:hypothetical protein [Candidatus Micrarchaeota archaeon]